MARQISIVYPYFDSPDMLAEHQKEWAKYPADAKACLEMVVVDDGSPNKPAAETIQRGKLGYDLHLYRIVPNIKWNWPGARNRGMHEAQGQWLFMSDIDHLLPVESVVELCRLANNEFFEHRKFYTFDRVNIDHSPYKNHPNTYFMSKALFWEMGGYDEEFVGMYGMDGPFRRQLERFSAGNIHLHDVKIVRYSREDIYDCSPDAPRKEGRDPVELQKIRSRSKKKFVNRERPLSLTFPFEKVF